MELFLPIASGSNYVKTANEFIWYFTAGKRTILWVSTYELSFYDLVNVFISLNAFLQ